MPGQFDDVDADADVFTRASKNKTKGDSGFTGYAPDLPTQIVPNPECDQAQYVQRRPNPSISESVGTAPNSEYVPVKSKKQIQTNQNENNRNQDGTTISDVTDNGDPTEVDVLCGRGGGTNNHIGNRYFRQLVEDHRDEYFMSKKLGKGQISRKIIAIIQARGGQFLKRDGSTGKWCDIGNKQATLKTSQALREGLDVKKRQAFLISQSIVYNINSSQPNNSIAGSASSFTLHDGIEHMNGQSHKRQRIAGPCA